MAPLFLAAGRLGEDLVDFGLFGAEIGEDLEAEDTEGSSESRDSRREEIPPDRGEFFSVPEDGRGEGRSEPVLP